MMIRAGLAALAAWMAVAPAEAQQQEQCGVFVVTSEERVSYIPIPGYTILAAIPPFGRPAGLTDLDAVVCDRQSIFIGPNDYRVLTDLSVPLYIRSSGRIAVLEASEGQLSVRFNQGAPTAEERQALAEALDRSEDALRSMPAQ